MFCENCGKELPDNSKFCSGCGAKTEEPAAQPAEPKKRGSRVMLFRIIAAVLIVALGASAGVGYFMNRDGASGDNNTIERGATASVKNGVIELNGVLLDFGGNNVGNATSLTVLKPTQEQEPGFLLSELFEMKLDAACISPVTIRIPFDESLLPTGEDAEDTSVMVGLGSRFPDEIGGTNTIYNFIPAEVEDGVVTAEFIPADYMQDMYITGNNGVRRTPDDVWLSFGVFTVTARYEGGHFKIFYSNSRSNAKVTRADCSAILSDLESAYEFFLSKGFDYSKRTIWPLEVNLGNYDNPGEYTMGGVINKLRYNQWDGWINLEDKFFIGGYRSDMMKPTIYHEFFHVVQSMYVADFAKNRWFDEATSSYWEWNVKGSMPDNVYIRLELLFEGLPSPNESSAAGYVRSALLKYVVEKQLSGDDGFIRDLYEAEPGDWNAAFVSATLPYGDYVASFFTEFLSGGFGPTAAACYSDITSGKMAKVGISKEMILPDKDILDEMRASGDEIPPLAVATVSVGAYGAQLVALPVYLETQEKMTDEDAVLFRVDGDCDFRVFEISTAYGRAATVHVPNTAGEVVIGGMNKSTSNYMVLVVGLHDNGKRDCDVVVELVSDFPTLDELVGIYEDGVMTITEFNVSDEFIAMLKALIEGMAEGFAEGMAGFAEGCDATSSIGAGGAAEGCDAGDIEGQIAEYKAMIVGQKVPIPFEIIKTGDNTGILNLATGDNSDMDLMGAFGSEFPFTYSGGILRFEKTETMSEDGATVTIRQSGAMTARYGPDKKIVILSGDVSNTVADVNAPGEGIVFPGELIKMSMRFDGTKPLP